MVTKFDVGDKVAIHGCVSLIEAYSYGTEYTIKTDSGAFVRLLKEQYLHKVEPANNDFPCKIGDKFYWVDTLLFKNITEVVCKGFREIGSTIYLLGSDGTSYYIGAVCFDRAEAEKALKERENSDK